MGCVVTQTYPSIRGRTVFRAKDRLALTRSIIDSFFDMGVLQVRLLRCCLTFCPQVQQVGVSKDAPSSPYACLNMQHGQSLERQEHTVPTVFPSVCIVVFMRKKNWRILRTSPYEMSLFQVVEVLLKVSATNCCGCCLLLVFYFRLPPLALQARGVVDAVCALHDANRGEVITTEVNTISNTSHSVP